jgi:elongation factor G
MSAADPTLGVTVGPVNEIILWGQNEPQMDSAVDHLRRGKGLDFQCGAPQVQYCETITKTLVWDYTHKSQTGSTGEYAKVKTASSPANRAEASCSRTRCVAPPSPTPSFPPWKKV